MKTPVLCLTLSLIACSGLVAQTPATSSKPVTQSSSSTGTHPTTHRMTVDPALLHPTQLKARAPEVFEATFDTTKGTFVVQVTRAWAPLGADRFYNLVKHGFFNGAPFFRVVPGFVVQFGLTGDKNVNHAWENASIKDDPVKQNNVPGTLVFAATSQPNSRSTQLFINLGDNTRSLDPQGFAPFGKVTSGMDVVRSIYSGYGENPDQGKITDDGSTYFLKAFPKMDLIKTATVTSPAPATTHSPTTTPHHTAPNGGSKPTQ